MLPSLPSKAAYLRLSNYKRRNALSVAVLQDLRSQLIKYNTSPDSGRLLLLPPFKTSELYRLDKASDATSESTTIQHNAQDDYSWLVDGKAWTRSRRGLPNVLVLRSDGDLGSVFSAGHDLGEIQSLAASKTERDAAGIAKVSDVFDLCAEVMSLIRRSPALVVCVVQGLATAAGAQLALACDFTVALETTVFRLPGMTLGLPCTSPATSASRRLGTNRAWRMFASAEGVEAGGLGDAIDVVPDPGRRPGGDQTSTGTRSEALESRVAQLVRTLASFPGQPQALGKWTFMTQAGITGSDWTDVNGQVRQGNGGDGFDDAVQWTGKAMALHARSTDAQEGISAFLHKRKPVWTEAKL